MISKLFRIVRRHKKLEERVRTLEIMYTTLYDVLYEQDLISKKVFIEKLKENTFNK